MLTSGNVIIVEDQPNFRKGLVKMLESQVLGWKVVGEAGNGQDALALVHRVKPDLVLTDIRMPVMDGMEFTGHLRESYPDMMVIVITAYRHFEYAQAAVRHGALDLLVKPCTEEDIRTVLGKASRHIQARESRRQTGLSGSNQPVAEGQLALNQAGIKELELQLMSGILQGQAGYVQQQLRKMVGELRQLSPDEAALRALTLSAGLHGTVRKQFPDLDDGSLAAAARNMPAANGAAGDIVGWAGEQAESFIRLLEQWQASKSDTAIEKALKYIEEHYDKACRLTDVADRVNLNPSYFSVMFKKAVGDSFTNYVNRVRMDKAAVLLRSTDLKIFEVACAVGFDEPNYFTNVFKQQYRMSPKEYRRMP